MLPTKACEEEDWLDEGGTTEFVSPVERVNVVDEKEEVEQLDEEELAATVAELEQAEERVEGFEEDREQ